MPHTEASCSLQANNRLHCDTHVILEEMRYIQDKRQKDLETNLMSHDVKLHFEEALVTTLMLKPLMRALKFPLDVDGQTKSAEVAEEGIPDYEQRSLLASVQLKTSI